MKGLNQSISKDDWRVKAIEAFINYENIHPVNKANMKKKSSIFHVEHKGIVYEIIVQKKEN